VLKQDREILATVLANLYPVTCDELKAEAFYFRYFASSPQHRGNVFVARTSTLVIDWMKKNSSGKTLFYAYLEKKNFQSSKLVASLGFEVIRSTSTYGFSRFFPKKDARVQKVLQAREKESVIDLLRDFYRHHSMVNFSSIHNNDNYFVIREHGEIVAGVQVVKSRWIVQQMEGWSGQLIMKAAPHIPFINRLFNPSDFNFVGFEGIYFKSGRKKDLMRLFEHILAEFQVNAGLFWQDVACPYNLKNEALGLINKFVEGTGSSLMVHFNETGDQEKELIKSLPVYISCFDFV